MRSWYIPSSPTAPNFGGARPGAPVLWDSTIELGEKFFQEIIAHPIPLDLNTLKALKRSPLGLDLYFWLVYRHLLAQDAIVPLLAAAL